MVHSLIPAKAIIRSDGILKTTSQKVAEAFNKRHSDLCNKIKSLDCSEKFRSTNFSAHPYTHTQNGETYYQYEMTKDGFIFLVMGFTGKKAAAIKEAYINAFNQMADELSRRPQTSPADRERLRDAVRMLASRKALRLPEAYSIIHQRFGVAQIAELTQKQLPAAVEYVHKLAMEGDWLPPQRQTAYGDTYAVHRWYNPYPLFNREQHQPDQVRMPVSLVCTMDCPSPTLSLLNSLTRDGHDVTACQSEFLTLRSYAQDLRSLMIELSRRTGGEADRVVTIRV